MEFRKCILVIWSVLSASTTVKTSENLAHHKDTTHSSDFNDIWVSSKAVDGCTLQHIIDNCCTHTALGQTEAWWQVDLQQQSVIETVDIIYRDEAALHRLAGFEIYLSNTSDWKSGERCYRDSTTNLALMSAKPTVTCPGVARYVTIYNDRRVKAYIWYSNQAYLELCEVYVNGCPVGKYGNGNCNKNCTNCLDNICDPTFGTCDVCDAGFYENGGICIPCPINCARNTCDSESGTCLECLQGFYGNECSHLCGHCQGGSCDQATGNCLTPCEERLSGDKRDVKLEEDVFNVAAIGIGIGSVVVIVALIIALIVQARRQQLRIQRDTKSTTDMSLSRIEQERRTDNDGTYDVIKANLSEEGTINLAENLDNYERLVPKEEEVPHLYDITS